jgi:hypothetical protein
LIAYKVASWKRHLFYLIKKQCYGKNCINGIRCCHGISSRTRRSEPN